MNTQAHVSMPTTAHLDRDAFIAAVKAALKARSGKVWSVKGGKGTAWGWVSICCQPKHLVNGVMTQETCQELATLLGLDRVHDQGVSIAASIAYRAEYLARALGETPAEIAQPYWD